MSTWTQRIGIGVVSLALGASLAACASSSSDQTQAQAQSQAAAAQCVDQLSPAQVAQMQQVAANSGQTSQVMQNANSTADVCVLSPQGDMQYYNQSDGFNDYLLYAMLMGNSRTLLTYGIISGDITPLQAMELSMIVGINDDGSVYHPYRYNASQHGYVYNPVRVNNYTVKYVQYGRSKPTGFSGSALTTTHKGYSRVSVPTASTKTASFSKTGKVSVSTLSGPTATKWGFKNPAKTGSGTTGGTTIKTGGGTTQKTTTGGGTTQKTTTGGGTTQKTTTGGTTGRSNFSSSHHSSS